MNGHGMYRPENHRDDGHEQRHVILFELEQRRRGDDRIGHDLFDHDGVGADERCQTVDGPFEEVLLVERQPVEDEVGECGEDGIGYGDDEVEFQQLLGTP